MTSPVQGPWVLVRKHLRLRSYDYCTAGAYFVTVCVGGKECLLGRVAQHDVVLSAIGDIVASHLTSMPGRISIGVDCFVVMPNHVHAVLLLGGDRKLGNVVGAFKAATAREINAVRGSAGNPFWQRGFFDHVLRNGADLERVREYVATNPIRWSLAREERAASEMVS